MEWDEPSRMASRSSGRWSVPRQGEAWLLANLWLEPLTKVHPITPLALFVPVVFLLLWRGISHQLPYVLMPALVLAGLFAWTFVEYLIHRWVFHFQPRTTVGVVIAYLVHGVHHAYPSDRHRLVMPPVVTVPPIVLLYGVFVASLGIRMGEVFFAGFLVGYLCYDMTHYLIHAKPTRTAWLSALKTNHMAHHFQCADRRFGVSTTLWDHVLRTR